MKNSFRSKLIALAGVALLLVFVLHMIQGVIRERQMYREQALNSVSASLAGPQTLLGPLLTMDCEEIWGGDSSPRKRSFGISATPQSLGIGGHVQVEQRTRSSIYEANVLNTKTILKARFDAQSALKPEKERKDSVLKCDAPILIVGLNDPRGIRSAKLKFNGQDMEFKADSRHPDYKRGMHVQLPANLPVSEQGWMAEISIDYVGTSQLNFVPLGDTTTMHVESNWPHPSFVGRFAPAERQIGEKGFAADWRLTSVATNASKLARQGKPMCPDAQTQDCVETVQIGFIDPVNFYSLSDRATKYGLLFVVLTFVAVGLFEVMKKLRVHPVQYLLAGAAICTFFLLLVSLSEHIGFAYAYVAGATATTLLLAYYASYMLGGLWRGLPFGAGIALLYGLLYALLQLEQTALVMGSVALFVVLALVMVLTRKLDWYAQFTPTSSGPERVASLSKQEHDALWEDTK